MKPGVPVAIVQLDHARGLPLPAYATHGSAGVDLTAAVAETVTLAANERALIPTGIAIALPDGFEAQVRPRSGLALKHGITVLNSPGTIDADYRGEVKIIMYNASAEPFAITRGMRIAQMVIAPVSRVQWQTVDQLPSSTRESGGFGSTGLE